MPRAATALAAETVGSARHQDAVPCRRPGAHRVRESREQQRTRKPLGLALIVDERHFVHAVEDDQRRSGGEVGQDLLGVIETLAVRRDPRRQGALELVPGQLARARARRQRPPALP